MKQRKRISLDWLDRGRTALEPLLALAYPRHCPLCGTVLEQSAWKAAVCRSCIPEAERLRHLPPRLPVTEHAFYAVNTCAAAFYYADSVRHAILLCKENGNPWYARELADLMAVLIFGAQPARAPGYRPVYENLSGISLYSAIVPVPPRVKKNRAENMPPFASAAPWAHPAHSGHPAAVPDPAGFTAKIAGPAKALCQCQGCLRLPYWG